MRSQLGVICVVVCTTLLGGCRTEYLAESRVLEQGWQVSSRSETTGQEQTVAVQVRLADPDDGDQAPRYVDLAALRVEKRRADGPWRVSARDRGGLLTVGSILLGIGLASVLGGGLALHLHSPCTMCNSETKAIDNDLTKIFAGTAITAGVLELIPGAILLGAGAPRVELPVGDRGVVYVPKTPDL